MISIKNGLATDVLVIIMSEPTDYWKKVYEGVTGSENDYFLAIHPDSPDCINRFYHYQKMKSFWELLRSCRLSKGRFVLDVGCGPGMFSELFYRSGARVVGIDVSKKLIERNNAAFPDIRFMNMSATTLDFENETFDIVNSMMVLQHIPETEQQCAISEMCRVLRPDGYIMIVESIYAGDKSVHVFPLPADEWIASFEKHGLSLVHWHGMEYVTLRRLYSKALGFAAKLKKGAACVSTGRQSTKHVTGAPVEDNASLSRKLLRTIEKAIIFLSYPLEPVSKAILPNKWAIRGAFLFKKTISE